MFYFEVYYCITAVKIQQKTLISQKYKANYTNTFL